MLIDYELILKNARNENDGKWMNRAPTKVMELDTDIGRRSEVASTIGEPNVSLTSLLARRKWPIVVLFLMFVVGMAFMFEWNPVVHHWKAWDTGGDLWGIYRGAHYVGWGFIGGIYDPSTGVITFPGMSVLLAPVAMFGGKLHLSESFLPYYLPHPTTALLLQPIELLLASTVVFASDSLAERLHIAKSRRIALCVLIGIVAWPTAAIWGHAEDALAMTFAIYAMVAMLNSKWSKCGWLFGFGIVIQPLVALTIPLFIAASPPGKRLLLAIRSAALSSALIGIAFAGDAGNTFRALVQQPTPPSLNHATPWAALAPVLPSGGVPTMHGASVVHRMGRYALSQVTSTLHPAANVAGGPGRSIDVVVALLFGLYVWRRPQHSIRLLWLAAVLLASRCCFEAVMTPYYLGPPLLLALAIASYQGGKRFWAACVIALEITVFAYHNLSPWAWWLPVVVGMAAVLALGYPERNRTGPEPPLASEPGDTAEVPAEELSEREPASTKGDELRPREPSADRRKWAPLQRPDGVLSPGQVLS